MSGQSLCPKCDQLSEQSSWEESGDYASCPSCGAWSLIDDVETYDTWICFSCNYVMFDEVDQCDLCGLSKDASDYLTAE